jgi:hypothetical protein
VQRPVAAPFVSLDKGRAHQSQACRAQCVFARCACSAHHTWRPLDRLVFNLSREFAGPRQSSRHWSLSSSTSLLPGPSAHGQISQPDIKPPSYDHQVTPLSCQLEHPTLRSTTRLPLSWADFHRPFQPSSLISSTFPQLQLPGPLPYLLLLSHFKHLDTHWTPPPPQAQFDTAPDISCTTSCQPRNKNGMN